MARIHKTNYIFFFKKYENLIKYMGKNTHLKISEDIRYQYKYNNDFLVLENKKIIQEGFSYKQKATLDKIYMSNTTKYLEIMKMILRLERRKKSSPIFKRIMNTILGSRKRDLIQINNCIKQLNCILNKTEYILSHEISLQIDEFKSFVAISSGEIEHRLTKIIYILIEIEKFLGEKMYISIPYKDDSNVDDLIRQLKNKLNLFYREKSYMDNIRVAKNTTIVSCFLSNDIAGRILHETIGHHTEGDVFFESGILRSFMEKNITNVNVNIWDVPNGISTPFKMYIDDRGDICKPIHIIKDGVFNSVFVDCIREEKEFFKISGNLRAQNLDDKPILRMRNTVMLNGKINPQEIIANISEGYILHNYIDGEVNYSGDFVFEVEFVEKIENGVSRELFGKTIFQGNVIDFLQSISKIADDFKWSGIL